MRATKDVDGVAASSSYAEYDAIQEQLRRLGFTDAGIVGDAGHHAHRWRTPTGQLFDLVPGGNHLGRSGSAWDAYALRTAEWLDVGRPPEAPDRIIIRHASAVAFLALKWAAYRDRGQQDKQASHDLEDILALLASRPTLVHECERAELGVREFMASQTQSFLDDPDVEEWIAAQLDVPRANAVRVRQQVHARLREIAAL